MMMKLLLQLILAKVICGSTYRSAPGPDSDHQDHQPPHPWSMWWWWWCLLICLPSFHRNLEWLQTLLHSLSNIKLSDWRNTCGLGVAAIVVTEGRLQVETGVDVSLCSIPAGDSRLWWKNEVDVWSYVALLQSILVTLRSPHQSQHSLTLSNNFPNSHLTKLYLQCFLYTQL